MDQKAKKAHMQGMEPTRDMFEKWLEADLRSINHLSYILMQKKELREALAEAIYEQFLEDQKNMLDMDDKVAEAVKKVNAEFSIDDFDDDSQR